MKFYILLVSMILPIISTGQTIKGKYINDNYNENYYLHFDTDSTFKYRVSYHVYHDISCGKYKVVNDTVFLEYLSDLRDTSCNKEMHPYFNYTESVKALRHNKLFYKDHKLYEIENGKIRFSVESNIKQPRSWGYHRKHFLNGPYIKKDAYYMIIETRVRWKKSN